MKHHYIGQGRNYAINGSLYFCFMAWIAVRREWHLCNGLIDVVQSVLHAINQLV